MELKEKLLNAYDKATRPKVILGVGLAFGLSVLVMTTYSGGTDNGVKPFEFTRYLESVGIK
jgi:acetyl-CoA carboxylase carboxyltransferase component